MAVDYSASASIEAFAGHDDNLRLVKDDKTSVMHYDLIPAIDFRADTEVSKFTISTRFDFNRYSESDFDSDDQTINMNYLREFENSTIGLGAKAVLNSTITSEELGSGRIGDTADPTELYMLTPSWSYTINQTNMLQWSASYAQQDYHTTNYISYQNIDSSLSWIYILNERWKLVLTGNYGDYQSDDRKFNVPAGPTPIFSGSGEFLGVMPPAYFGQQRYSEGSKTEGGQVGMNYMVTEQSELQVSFGRSNSTRKTDISDFQNICTDPLYQDLVGVGNQIGAVCSSLPKDKTTLSTAQVSWNWNNERQEFNLNASKTTQPTSNGYTVDATQVSSGWNYKLTELDQFFVDMTLVRNRAIDKATDLRPVAADRDYQTAGIRYQRRIGREWFITTGYQYKHQEYTESDYKASGQVVSLAVRYQPAAWHWSR